MMQEKSQAFWRVCTPVVEVSCWWRGRRGQC